MMITVTATITTKACVCVVWFDVVWLGVVFNWSWYWNHWNFHCYGSLCNYWKWHFLLVNDWTIDVDGLRDWDWFFHNEWNLLFVNDGLWDWDFYWVWHLLFNMHWIATIDWDMTNGII